MNVYNNPDVQRLAQIYRPGDGIKSKAILSQSVGKPSAGDSVSLSKEAKMLAGIRQRLSETPDIRRERVEALKSAIANGTYHVASGDIADAMLREGALS